MIKGRVPDLTTSRDRATGYTVRIAVSFECQWPATTAESLRELAWKARRKLRTEDGRYRRDHLSKLAQRVEVGNRGIRVMG